MSAATTKHQVHEPDSEAWPPTELERANLNIAGFYDLDEKYPEYGQRSLVCAYRAGYHDAPSVAAELRSLLTELESGRCGSTSAMVACVRRRIGALDPQGGQS